MYSKMMKKLENLAVFVCFSFFMLLVTHFMCPATSQEVEDTSTFDYLQGSLRGPARWGDLRPEWGTCNNGTMQSPIDLLDHRVQTLSHLQTVRRVYSPANATLKNRGHDMMLTWHSGGAGFVEINGSRYELRQCHWHSPSEHTINADKFDLELHLVHQSLAGQIVVIGVTYRINLTHPDSFLSLMRSHLLAIISNTTTTQDRTVVGVFDPNQIRIGSRRYYKYIGSLTVPPCTQNVVWLVSKRVRPVTSRQVNLLRVAVNDGFDFNARPAQQNYGRTVLYAQEETFNDQEINL